MTALAAAPAASARPATSFDRIWRVVRLQYVNWRTALLIPWAILFFILLVNLTIWYLIVFAAHTTHMTTQYTGSIFYLFIYQGVLGVQLMSLTFSYALGMSSTRRDYFFGTALWALLHAAQFTVGVVLLMYIEQWTHGWGVGGHMFQTVYMGTGPLWQRLFTVFFGMLCVMFVGSIFGAVYVRWRANGLYVVGAIFVFALLAAAALITFTHAWPATGAWFARNSAFGVVAWSIPLTAIAGVIGFLALRRAVPRG